MDTIVDKINVPVYPITEPLEEDAVSQLGFPAFSYIKRKLSKVLITITVTPTLRSLHRSRHIAELGSEDTNSERRSVLQVMNDVNHKKSK